MEQRYRMERPIERSRLRAKCGLLYYGACRRLLWLTMRRRFAAQKGKLLPCVQAAHHTILLRKLRDVDMQYQYNKIINLRVACAALDGVLLRPGQVFSYWRLLGRPTYRKGYVDGMVLHGGTFGPGVGGGLCQMSNLIYWMTLHTPLTVLERHRHGYDVFPDSNRTQPFGSGATCFYPHGDLMIRNDTGDTFQLHVWLTDTELHGEWRATAAPCVSYRVLERNHVVRGEYWGGFSRHNELYRQVFSLSGELLAEEFIVANHALMMYSPFLGEPNDPARHVQ